LVLQGALRVTVAVQCWGAAAQAVQGSGLSPPMQLLQAARVIPEALAERGDALAAAVLVVIGLAVLVRPNWPGLLATVGWFAAAAAAAVLGPGESWDWLSPGEQLVRIAAPMSLALLDWWPPRARFSLGRFLVALWMLRATAGLSTIAQGIKTLADTLHREQLYELLEGFVVCCIGPAPPVEHHERWLGLVGGLDVGLALAFLTVRSRPAAGLLIGWNVLRIGAWTLAFGTQGYSETLLRVAQAGGPLVILLFWLLTVRETPPTILPAPKK
jgi:hypothetical protein